jgi:membrane protease YdiL (CAAX protease family)
MTSVSAFKTTRARTLLIWLGAWYWIYDLIWVHFGVHLEKFGAGEMTDWIYDLDLYVFYAILLGWSACECSSSGVSARQLIGPPPRNLSKWGWVALLVPLYLVGVTTLIFVFAIAELSPVFAASLLNGFPPMELHHEVIVGLVLAPVIEELFFRGVLLHRWADKWGCARAILATSVLFASYHPNILGAFVFGVVMSLVYLRTRTLLVPMLMHFINNAIVILPDVFTASDPGATPPGEMITPGEVIARYDSGFMVFSLISVFVGLFIFYVLRHRLEPSPGAPLPCSQAGAASAR